MAVKMNELVEDEFELLPEKVNGHPPPVAA